MLKNKEIQKELLEIKSKSQCNQARKRKKQMYSDWKGISKTVLILR